MEKCYSGGRDAFSPSGVVIETGGGVWVSLFWHSRITVGTTSQRAAAAYSWLTDSPGRFVP